MLFYPADTTSKKYIFLRISEKCSCNCRGCNLPKMQQNSDISIENLDSILGYIENNFSPGFELNFIGYNVFSHKNIGEIFQKNYSLPTSFHIDYSDLIQHFKIIIDSDFIFTIQKNIYSLSDFKRAISILNFIQKNNIKNTRIDFLFSFSQNSQFFQYFCKHFNIVFENNFRGTFSLSGSKISIENIYSEEFGPNCNFTESYIYGNTKIFVKDNIEICLRTGDIKTHLSSYCNFGIRSLGNIYDTQSSIYSNFQTAYKILKDNEKLGSQEKCMSCLNNPIKL